LAKDGEKTRRDVLIKFPVRVKQADDATTDDVHAGEPGYLSCIFAGSLYQVTVILSDDPDKWHYYETDKGFATVSGFGDKARAYVGREPHWVDVMKGKTFCEIIVGIPTDQFVDGDWTRGGAKACVAAFAAR
jgi:hypothetical protein